MAFIVCSTNSDGYTKFTVKVSFMFELLDIFLKVIEALVPGSRLQLALQCTAELFDLVCFLEGAFSSY